MARLFDPNKAYLLDGAERRKWNDPAAIVASVGIAPGDRVAEIGAGTGWFTFELERAVRPRGMVYALDTQTAMLQILETKRQNYERVLTLPCGENSFDLDDGEVDTVFHANVLHETSEPATHLKEAYRVLKNGGRLVVIEWLPGKGEEEPGPRPENRLSPDDVESALKTAGFSLRETKEIGPYHFAVIGTKA